MGGNKLDGARPSTKCEGARRHPLAGKGTAQGKSTCTGAATSIWDILVVGLGHGHGGFGTW
jgi:hypothetical protein